MCKARFNSLYAVIKHHWISGLLLFYIIPINSFTIFARFCLLSGGGGSDVQVRSDRGRGQPHAGDNCLLWLYFKGL